MRKDKILPRPKFLGPKISAKIRDFRHLKFELLVLFPHFYAHISTNKFIFATHFLQLKLSALSFFVILLYFYAIFKNVFTK